MTHNIGLIVPADKLVNVRGFPVRGYKGWMIAHNDFKPEYLEEIGFTSTGRFCSESDIQKPFCTVFKKKIVLISAHLSIEIRSKPSILLGFTRKYCDI